MRGGGSLFAISASLTTALPIRWRLMRLHSLMLRVKILEYKEMEPFFVTDDSDAS